MFNLWVLADLVTITFTALDLRLDLRGKGCWFKRKSIINQNFESWCFQSEVGSIDRTGPKKDQRNF